MGERVKVDAKKPEVKQDNVNSRMRGSEYSWSMDTGVERILYLQRTAGNQAVSRLMKSGALQAKMRIGQPGDKYEQEADRVADTVMRMPEPGVQRQVEPEEEEEMLQAKPFTKVITPLVLRQVETEEEEEPLQAKATSGHLSEANPDFESQIQSLKGGGKPLPESERAYFGHFSESLVMQMKNGSKLTSLSYRKWLLLTKTGHFVPKYIRELEKAGYKIVIYVGQEEKMPSDETPISQVRWLIKPPEGEGIWANAEHILKKLKDLVKKLRAAKPKEEIKKGEPIKLFSDPKYENVGVSGSWMLLTNT